MYCDYCGKPWPMTVNNGELHTDHYELQPNPLTEGWPEGVERIYLCMDCGGEVLGMRLSLRQVFDVVREHPAEMAP